MLIHFGFLKGKQKAKLQIKLQITNISSLLAIYPAQVEQFWSYYAHMTRPHDINSHAYIHLLKDGIRPLWEDEANKNGLLD